LVARDQTSPPYWITIVIATVAWLFTTTVDQVLRTPYLVCDVKTDQSNKDISAVRSIITIANITEDKAYKDLTIRFLVDEPDTISGGGVRPYQPGWEGDTASSTSTHSFEHNFPIIQPAGQFDISITHKYKGMMHIVLRSPSTVVLLIERTYVTFLVEHHVINSIIGIVILFVVMIWFLLRSSATFAKAKSIELGMISG
jgi:hypothetical protein